MNYKRVSFSVLFAALLTSAPARANVTFNLIPDADMPQYAIDGFNSAANLWSSVLGNNITINLQIGFTSLGSGIIGSTSTSALEKTYMEVRQALATNRTSADDYSSYAGLQSGSSFNRLINHTSNNPNGANSATPYVDSMNRVGMTTANAKALGLLGASSDVDATIRFSSDFSFDFSHGESIEPNKYDFVGAAAHEIGHVLGFISGVDDIDQSGGTQPGGGFSSNMIDLFRYSPLSLSSGTKYTDYTADNRNKYFSVNGGTNLVAYFAVGVNYGDGRQASHWKDNLEIGIMDPTEAQGERLAISPTDLRLFDVIGYTLVPEASSGILGTIGFLVVLLVQCRRKATALNGLQ